MKLYVLIYFIIILNTQLFSSSHIEVLKNKFKNHTVLDYKTRLNWQDKSIQDKISTAPSIVTDYISIENELDGYDERPQQVKIDEEFKKDLLDAIDELPLKVKQQVKSKLIGIFIVSDLGSTGYSEHIYNKDTYYGGFIVLDQNILINLKANEWASWRLNSSFVKSNGYDLSLKIEEKSSNNRKQAIQFILLHEIAHIIGLSSKAHPRTTKGNPTKYPFSSLSWIDFKTSVFDKTFTSRRQIKMYAFDKSTLHVKESNGIFSHLKSSAFSSMYGGTSYYEDFAEAYTIYVHNLLMNKPYHLTLTYDGKVLQELKNPFLIDSFKNKKDYFRKLF